AGLTHAASRPGPPLLPNRLVAVGSELARNDAYAITQWVWPGERHSGTDVKSPPTVLPAGTCSRVPIRIAETSRCCTGLPSISLLISWVSTVEPWLCPISTTPRPLL